MIWVTIVDGLKGTAGKKRCAEGSFIGELFDQKHPRHTGKMLFLLNGKWVGPGMPVVAGDRVAWVSVEGEERCPTGGSKKAHWGRRDGG